MKIKQIFWVVVISAALFSCKNENNSNVKINTIDNSIVDEHKGQATVADNVSDANALQVAKSLPDFTTLVTAIETAGVEDAIVNAGPLTIFAPTNEAFAKLPDGTVETLLKPENRSRLALILTNHVAPSNYPDTQLEKEARKGRNLYMASGNYLEVEKKDDGLYVGGTKILKTVKVSNGWIHIIGDVLVPAENN